MKKIAVVLAGNGVYDGAEIHEATLTLLAIARNGAQYQCFAPDIKRNCIVISLGQGFLQPLFNIVKR